MFVQELQYQYHMSRKRQSFFDQQLEKQESNYQQIDCLEFPEPPNSKINENINFSNFEDDEMKILNQVFPEEQANKEGETIIQSQNSQELCIKRERKNEVQAYPKKKRLIKKQKNSSIKAPKASKNNQNKTKTKSSMQRTKDESRAIYHKIQLHFKRSGLEELFNSIIKQINPNQTYPSMLILNKLFANQRARPEISKFLLGQYRRKTVISKSTFGIYEAAETNSKRNSLKNYFFTVYSFIQGGCDSRKYLRYPAQSTKIKIQAESTNYQNKNKTGKVSQKSNSSSYENMEECEFQKFDI